MLGLKPKLIVLLSVVVVAMIAVTVALTSKVGIDLSDSMRDQLKSGNEVVRLASSVESYSVLHEALEAATNPAVVTGFGCPPTPEALSEARRTPPPTIGPNGEAIPGVPATTCADTSHNLVLSALKSWSQAREADRANNQARYLAERELGYAIPREPDLLIAADADGVVVARVGFDKDDWYGPSRPNMTDEYGAVARAELGSAQFDYLVWREHGDASPQLARIGAAPVHNEEGEFLGTVTVGYFLTDAAADDAAQFLVPGTDVAYYFRGDGNAVSYAGTTASDPQFLQAVQGATFERDGQTATFAELALQNQGVVYQFNAGGTTYMAMSTTLSTDEAGTAVQSGFVVINSLTAATAPLERVTKVVPLLGVALLVLGILGILVAVKQFMVPVEEVSKGVQEVIAGNREYMWEVDGRSHLSDLAHSLNIMSARLQGKRDPDAEDTDGDADWQDMAGGGGAPPQQKPTGVAGLGGLRGRVDDDDDDDE